MSVALRARQPPGKPYHGKFLYLFSNLRTNQVIYSLEQEIHTEKQERMLLQQLAFYGKKTVPTKLRPDYWKPFATVTFPNADDGLQAYRLLREYRVVRDHAWTFAPTEADIALATEREEKELEKKEKLEKGTAEEDNFRTMARYPHRYSNTMSHYTSFPNRKERVHLLMDQRATSVADLAHIITRQLNRTGDAKQRNQEVSRAKLWNHVKTLAARDTKPLEEDRANIEAALAATPTAQTLGRAEQIKRKARMRQLARVIGELGHLRKAREVVAFANGEDVPEVMRAKWSKTLKYIAQQQNPSTPVLSSYNRADAEEKRRAREAAHFVNMKGQREKLDAAESWRPKALTKRDRIALKNFLKEEDTRAENGVADDEVLIEWANLPDAQFAQEWDVRVKHGEMLDVRSERARRRIARESGVMEETFLEEETVEASDVARDEAYEEFERRRAVAAESTAESGKSEEGPVIVKEDKRGWLGRMFGRKGDDART